jgi:hypothetical protein
VTSANDFLGWLLEDVDTVTAEVGTPRDVQLKAFEAHGFLRFKGMWADTNAYEITSKWVSALAVSSRKQGCE